METVGGTVADLGRIRVYVNQPLDAEACGQVNAARRDFCPDERHFPSGMALEVTDAVNDDYRVAIEADAILPEYGWDPDISESGSETGSRRTECGLGDRRACS